MGGDGEALGGAIFNLNGSVTLQNATLAGNSAGRGIDVFNLAHETTAGVVPADATLTLTNTILDSSNLENVENAQVGADPGSAVVNGDATDILRGSVVNNGGTVNDTGIVIDDALLGVLIDNGGPTPTHAPQFPGSPAIDASASGAATDQRGVARPQGASFDIGAVEVPQFTGVLAPGDLLLTASSQAARWSTSREAATSPWHRASPTGSTGPFGLCTGPGGEVYVDRVRRRRGHGDHRRRRLHGNGGLRDGPGRARSTWSAPTRRSWSRSSRRGRSPTSRRAATSRPRRPSPSAWAPCSACFRDSSGTLWAVESGGPRARHHGRRRLLRRSGLRRHGIGPARGRRARRPRCSSS